MNITLWGPGLWELIHTTAFNYNKSSIPSNIKKIKYINLFNSLGNLIPCNKCKKHYIIFLRNNPIRSYTHTYNGIIKWVNNLHNSINKKLKKQTYSLKLSKQKYYNKNINHQKIYNFINNLVSAVNIKQLRSLKIFMNSILYLFPCETCRKKLVHSNKLNKQKKLILKNLKNVAQIKRWYSVLNLQSLHR